MGWSGQSSVMSQPAHLQHEEVMGWATHMMKLYYDSIIYTSILVPGIKAMHTGIRGFQMVTAQGGLRPGLLPSPIPRPLTGSMHHDTRY